MWIKWLIPLGLAVLAGVLNYLAGVQQQNLNYYVIVQQNVRVGEKFASEMLAKIAVPANQETLKGSAIPYADRAVLYGKPCPRELTKGDIVFWRDTIPPPVELNLEDGELAITIKLESKVHFPTFVKVGDEIGFMLASAPPEFGKLDPGKKPPRQEFEYVGPFRLVGIDKQYAREDPTNLNSRPFSDDRDITVAFKLTPGKKADENTTRLLQARMQRAGSGAGGVEALVLHANRPTKKAPSPQSK